MAANRRVPHAEHPPALSRAQELDLIDALRDTYPDRFGLDGELWNRHSLASLIRLRHGLTLDQEALAAYLRAWGLEARDPTDRACPLCADGVRRWARTTYPVIIRSARDHGAEVYWVGRTRLLGVTPAADVLSAVSDHGRLCFMVTSAAEPPPHREFLLRLSGPEAQTVHAVADGTWPPGTGPRRLPARIVLHPLPSCGRAVVAGGSRSGRAA